MSAVQSRRVFVVLGLAPFTVFAWQKKSGGQSNNKGPEIELVSSSAHVENQRVNIDGEIRNVSGRPIRRLNIIYEVLDGDKKVLTRQKGPIDEEELGEGEESEFRAQMHYHARAVYYRFEFEDGGGRDLRSEKTGPFPIE